MPDDVGWMSCCTFHISHPTSNNKPAKNKEVMSEKHPHIKNVQITLKVIVKLFIHLYIVMYMTKFDETIYLYRFLSKNGLLYTKDY